MRLTMIADQLAGSGTRAPGGIGRYTENLVAALAAGASGDELRAFIAGHPPAARARVAAALPDAVVEASPLPAPVLSRLWQRGLPLTGPRGAVHTPSLLAAYPRGARVVTTFHDTVPWSRPETLTPHGAQWHRAMAEQAWRHAAAIVTSTRAVADEVAAIHDFGERVHVIPPAVSPTLRLPSAAASGADGAASGTDADALDRRAAALGLPAEYVLSVGTLEPRKALGVLLRAMARPEAPQLPLVVVGPLGWGGVSVAEAAERVGLHPGRVMVLGYLDDADLAVAYAKATIFAFPSLAEGFGLPLLEAFSFGTPSITSDDPSLVEVGAGAARVVERSTDPQAYADALAAALAELAGDSARRARLGAAGRARAADFSWTRAAEAVWALHRSV